MTSGIFNADESGLPKWRATLLWRQIGKEIMRGMRVPGLTRWKRHCMSSERPGWSNLLQLLKILLKSFLQNISKSAKFKIARKTDRRNNLIEHERLRDSYSRLVTAREFLFFDYLPNTKRNMFSPFTSIWLLETRSTCTCVMVAFGLWSRASKLKGCVIVRKREVETADLGRAALEGKSEGVLLLLENEPLLWVSFSIIKYGSYLFLDKLLDLSLSCPACSRWGLSNFSEVGECMAELLSACEESRSLSCCDEPFFVPAFVWEVEAEKVLQAVNGRELLRRGCSGFKLCLLVSCICLLVLELGHPSKFLSCADNAEASTSVKWTWFWVFLLSISFSDTSDLKSLGDQAKLVFCPKSWNSSGKVWDWPSNSVSSFAAPSSDRQIFPLLCVLIFGRAMLACRILGYNEWSSSEHLRWHDGGLTNAKL